MTRNQFVVALLLFILPAAGYAVYWMFPTADNSGYAPEQPIPFSHKLHAGTNKIDCQYCHQNAERSFHATIPPVSTCMNCHKVVKVDSPWIQQLAKHAEEGTPVEWVRIHELPDHAHFPHSSHVNAGVSCQTCHGPIETMDKVYQFAPLNMGWCLNCHRGDSTPKNVLQNMYPDDQDAKGRQVGPLNCVACHY